MKKQGDCFVPRNDVGKATYVRHCEKTPEENFKLNKKHQGFSWQSSKAY